MKNFLAHARTRRDARLIRTFEGVAILVQEQAQSALGTPNEWPQDRYAATAPLEELALKLALSSYAELPVIEEGDQQ